MKLSSKQVNELHKLVVTNCPLTWHGMPDGVPDDIQELINLGFVEERSGVYKFIRLTEKGCLVHPQYYLRD